ncbi:MAG: hypothetical protein QGH40_07865 [bacterium]|jgi:hypothetical protein|nr:hypothetical protein [bacterium]
MCEDTDYNPLFAEEIFIVNLYGTDEEIQRFQGLIARREETNSLVAIVDLVEKIKSRCLTGMEWHCCWRCQYFQMCRIRWYREEHQVSQRCCSLCRGYMTCMSKFRSSIPKDSSGDSPLPGRV